MEERKNIVKNILISRRSLLATSKLMEDKNLSLEALLHLKQKYLLLLKQTHFLSMQKTLLASIRLTEKKKKTHYFWESDCQNYDECFFKNYFRMGRTVFYKLCRLLSGIHMRLSDKIPLEKKIAISLYVLGSTTKYSKIAKRFGVENSSVYRIFLRFCDEVWRVLGPMYLKNFPLTREKLESLVQDFEELGFPQCMGAIDGCHIEIQRPHKNPTSYLHCNGRYAIALLALVDARTRFIYVNSGNAGGFTYSKIYQESSLKQQLDQCNLLHDLKQRISGVDVPIFIIGDSQFRLSDKLMKPYPSQLQQTRQQKCFNRSLTKSHTVAKKAFKHLKARFKRIGGKAIDNIRITNAIILACCALHNFLNEHNDAINENWLEAFENIETKRSYPEFTVSLTDHSNNPEIIRSSISAYLAFNVNNDGDDITDTGDEDCARLDDERCERGDDNREGCGDDIGGGSGDNGSDTLLTLMS